MVKEDECPVYDNTLDDEQSQPRTGAFAFHIASNNSSYLAVYCQEGYFSRTETVNSNLADGTRVQPDPVKLIPLKSKLPVNMTLSSVVFMAMASDLDKLRLNFRYYRNVAPLSFSEALRSRLAPADRDMVEALTERSEPFQSAIRLGPNRQFRELNDSAVAFVATATDIDSAHADFVYFDHVDESAYATARSKFAAQDRRIVDRIRTVSPYRVSAGHQ